MFFLQAEDGIRDYKVTGVQTCALPILGSASAERCTPIDRDTNSRLPHATAFTRWYMTFRPYSPRDSVRAPVAEKKREIGRASCREREQSAEGARGMKKEERRKCKSTRA